MICLLYTQLLKIVIKKTLKINRFFYYYDDYDVRYFNWDGTTFYVYKAIEWFSAIKCQLFLLVVVNNCRVYSACNRCEKSLYSSLSRITLIFVEVMLFANVLYSLAKA